jgi:hypothetical protein
MADNFVARDGNANLITKAAHDITGTGVLADRVVPCDSVNDVKTTTLANLQANLEVNSMLTGQAGEVTAQASIVTGTTTPSASLSAPGAGKIYVVKWLTISLGVTSAQVPLLFELVQDAGGTPLVLWSGTLAGVVNTSSQISLKCNIPQTVANKTLTLSVVTGTIVSTNYIAVAFGATISQ